MAEQNESQVEVADRLKTAVLVHFENLLTTKTINATELSVLVRLLMANGWVLDRSRLPKGLADKLTDPVTDEEYAGVLPIRKPA